MEGFVNNSTVSPFEYGLVHSKLYANYGYDKTYKKDESKPVQQNQNKQSINLQPTYGSDILGLSLPTNIDDAVDTIATPNQKPHQRLKTAGIIGGSAVMLGGLTMIFTKGKISKGIAKSLNKLTKNIESKIEKIKEKPSISTLEGKYLSVLQVANSALLMVRGAFFNISPLKDVLFEKFAREKCHLDKPCDAITNGFRKMSFRTVKNSYKKAAIDMYDMTNEFAKMNIRIASGEFGTEKAGESVVNQLNEGVHTIKTEYASSFGKYAVENREKSLVKKFKGLGGRVYDAVYGRLKDFVTDFDAWTTFISERLVSKDKAEIIENLATKRRVITNNPYNNYKSMSEIISNIEKVVNNNSKISRDTVKNLKTLTNQYISISGKGEGKKRAEIVKEINAQLRMALKQVPKENYNEQQEKYIIAQFRNFGKVVNTDKKGAIEEMLTMYKEILPPEEYAKLQASAHKSVKSLNKAIHTEGYKYTDKVRDLSVGSALTDVAIGTAVPVVSTSVAISAAKTKEKRRSVALKYGLPLLAGIATTTACTVRLISGGRALMLGGLVSIVGNELCERLDNYLIARDAKNKK